MESATKPWCHKGGVVWLMMDLQVAPPSLLAGARGNEMKKKAGTLVVALTVVCATSAVPPASAAEAEGQVTQPVARGPAKSSLNMADSLQRELAEIAARPVGQNRDVEIKVRSAIPRSEARDLAESVGGALRMSAGGYHWMSVPVERVSQVASHDSVEYVGLGERPFPLADTSEGVATMSASEWTNSDLTGDGIDVGIIDIGFSGYAAAVASGDLPADLITRDFCFDFGATVHGTGVAEIVHDVAPDARLHLICIDDIADLADAVTYAKSAGIDVINHSVGWFNSSRGDGSGGPGTPEGIAESAIEAGIVWVNAAGNHAARHWKGKFDDLDSDGVHEFVPGVDIGNAFELPPGRTVAVFLKWDSWPVTAVDYDLYLYDHDIEDVVAASEDTQNGSQPPTEQLTFTNFSGSPKVVEAVITKFAGSGSPRIDLFVTTSSLQYRETAGSLLEPAGHPKVITVGATCWSDDHLASYSSRGPNIAGDKKPDVTAPTGVTTSVYGAGSANCNSGFAGTSSAAPHTAGMAALVLQGSPSLSPSKVADRLEANVVDFGGAGKDNKFGSGRLDAHGLCDGQVASIVGTDDADTLSGTPKRDVIAGYGGGDLIKGNGGNDLICAGNGFDTVLGGDGNDEMRGQNGNDLLLGGPDADKYYGGPGDNTASFVDATGPVTVDLDAGTATGEGTDKLSAILNVWGSPFDDQIQGSDQANVILSMAGHDIVLGGDGADELIGGPGGDELLGGNGADTLDGENGADTLRGGRGFDLLIGGPHPDDIRGGRGHDTVSYRGAPGMVTVRLDKRRAFGAWALDQLLAIENIIGSPFADILVGNVLANRIKGRSGDDLLRGGPGDDSIHGQGGFDEARGGGGLDLCLTAEVITGCE